MRKYLTNFSHLYFHYYIFYPSNSSIPLPSALRRDICALKSLLSFFFFFPILHMPPQDCICISIFSPLTLVLSEPHTEPQPISSNQVYHIIPKGHNPQPLRLVANIFFFFFFCHLPIQRWQSEQGSPCLHLGVNSKQE